MTKNEALDLRIGEGGQVGRWSDRIVGFERIDPLQILANPFNHRIHSQYQQEIMEDTLDDLGWIQTVIINKNTGHVVDGHLRVILAVREKERTGENILVPVLYVDLSEDEEKAALATFDWIGSKATIDTAMLVENLRSVTAPVLTNSLTKLTKDFNIRVPKLTGGSSAPEESSGGEELAPEVMEVAVKLVEKWGVEYGDVWELGEHVIACVDTTDPNAWAQIVVPGTAVLVAADPPYGMGKEKDGIENDNLYQEKLDDFQTAWWQAVRPFMVENGSAYVCGNAPDLWRWSWYN